MAKAVVPNGAQAAREDMAEVSSNKLPTGHGSFLEAVIGTVFPEERDGLVRAGNHPFITNDAAGHISSEVSNGRGAGTGGLDMHAPAFGPDDGINLPTFNFEQAAEVLAESGLEERKMKEIVRLFDTDDFAIGIEARAGDQEVQMRMELHLLAPGVEDGGEPADRGAETFGGGKFFGHGGGNRREKEIVELFGQRAKEAVPQFLRQGESPHKVRRVDLLLQSSFDPGGGGGLAAARTGFVIATMEGKVIGSTTGAGIARPSQGRGAAMGDGPDGAALRAGERRRSLQKPGQKTSQHLGDGGPAP